jgi:hypothetical protein
MVICDEVGRRICETRHDTIYWYVGVMSETDSGAGFTGPKHALPFFQIFPSESRIVDLLTSRAHEGQLDDKSTHFRCF